MITTQTIYAYDRGNHPLWIGRETEPLVANNPCWQAMETGMVVGPDGPLNEWVRIAYFRVYSQDVLKDVHFTRHGREVGMRNWQARRTGDPILARHYVGEAPTKFNPHVERHGRAMWLCVGEGSAADMDHAGWQRDRFDYPVLVLARAVPGTQHAWTVHRASGEPEFVSGVTRTKVERQLVNYGAGFSDLDLYGAIEDRPLRKGLCNVG